MEQKASVRVSNSQGRCGSANHNSRFLKEERDHINVDMTKENILLVNIDDEMRRVPSSSSFFKDAQIDCYKELYQDHLDEQNARYHAKRQYKREKTIKDIFEGKKTAPMESILQIGKTGEFEITSENIRKFKEMVLDHIEWIQENCPNIKVLSVAIHTDEASLHAHLNYTVFDIDQHGHRYPQQDKGLQAMGIEPPNPEKPISRFNNRLQTLTQILRANWISAIKKRAPELSLELKPEETKRQHLSKIDYQLFEAQRKSDEEAEKIKKQQAQMLQNQQVIDVQLSTIDVLTESEGLEREIADARTRQKGRSR